MWTFIIILGILCLLFYFLAQKLGNLDKKIMEKRMEPINEINKEYKEELKKWCIANNVAFKENIMDTEEVWVNQLPGYLWFNNKDIVFCPDSINCGIPVNINENIKYVKYKNIEYFSKDGSVSYTNQIKNSGKNISVSGAVIGGLIGGDTGAVIGSMKDKNKIDNITVKHDEIHTYIYYKNNDNIELLDIKGESLYSSILHLMPEKEYDKYIVQKTSDKQYNVIVENERIESKLEKLKSLYDKNLITKDEYDKKRQEILNKIYNI